MIKIILTLLCLSLNVLSSTLFIGNGGETYFVDKSYFLRDLVEAGVQTSPYFHCSGNTPIDDKLDLKKLEFLGLDIRLLSQKLCDLDLIYPGFRAIFVDALNFHSWTRIDEPLGLLPDDGPLLKFKSTERNQIANRTLFNIRVQWKLWNQLNSKNRLALIIHEIVFSLLKPSCTDTTCVLAKQTPRKAREITGLLFSPQSFQNSKSKRKLQSLMFLFFNLSSISEADWGPPNTIRISYPRPGEESQLGVEKQEKQSIPDYLNNVCVAYLGLRESFSSTQISLTYINRHRFDLVPFIYQTSYGDESGLSIKRFVSMRSSSFYGIKDRQSCLVQLSEKISEFEN